MADPAEPTLPPAPSGVEDDARRHRADLEQRAAESGDDLAQATHDVRSADDELGEGADGEDATQ